MCGSSLRHVCPVLAGASEMAFGFMNTRRYALLYSFLASLFMNCVSVYWTMWSVLTISLFMLTLTDFMFFQVHRGLWCPIGLGAGGEGRVARGAGRGVGMGRVGPPRGVASRGPNARGPNATVVFARGGGSVVRLHALAPPHVPLRCSGGESPAAHP